MDFFLLLFCTTVKLVTLFGVGVYEKTQGVVLQELSYPCYFVHPNNRGGFVLGRGVVIERFDSADQLLPPSKPRLRYLAPAPSLSVYLNTLFCSHF